MTAVKEKCTVPVVCFHDKQPHITDPPNINPRYTYIDSHASAWVAKRLSTVQPKSACYLLHQTSTYMPAQATSSVQPTH